jgi:prepilin-type N-terminal cleavage/methylation domain-containing protein
LSKFESQAASKSQEGFTLIELIATLVIISVLAGVLIPRYLDAETSAQMRGLDMGVSELNGRETLVWALTKLSTTGYTNDEALWVKFTENPGFDLGPEYDWPIGDRNDKGGTLRFKKQVSAALTRSPSNTEIPGRWRRP